MPTCLSLCRSGSHFWAQSSLQMIVASSLFLSKSSKLSPFYIHVQGPTGDEKSSSSFQLSAYLLPLETFP